MEQRRTVSAFLESGPWVPLEVAAPLSQCLQRLDDCLKTPHAVNPTLAWLVHLKVTKLKQLLAAGRHRHRLVPADQWQRTAYDIKVLTRWLVTTR